MTDSGVADPNAKENQTPEAIQFNSHSVAWMFNVVDDVYKSKKAMTQLYGNDIYFRTRGSAEITAATVSHETLHQSTHMGDIALAAKLGVPSKDKIESEASRNISKALSDHHCY